MISVSGCSVLRKVGMLEDSKNETKGSLKWNLRIRFKDKVRKNVAINNEKLCIKIRKLSQASQITGEMFVRSTSLGLFYECEFNFSQTMINFRSLFVAQHL